MKVTNWRRKIVASIIAGGAIVHGTAYAVDIPLLDPSFEVYTVPTFTTLGSSTGYAYAGNPHGSYRPASAWIDDIDSPVGYTQDDGDSNWLYSSAYGEANAAHRRPAPRTGDQAMHGLGNYNAQKVATTFAAEKTYTFSIFAQGDIDASTSSSRVFLYLFDGSKPFSEATSLNFQRFAPDTGNFVNRGAADTSAQSKAKWTQISISHTAFPGSPEIGKQIGVAFWGAEDSAVDDASLNVVDSNTVLLVLEVNTTNGQVRVRNQTAAPIRIDYYDIKSAGGALSATNWNSLQEQNLAGFPAGNGSGNGWEQAGGSTSTAIGESYLTGDSSIANATNVGLGQAFNVGGAQDLVFKYGAVVSTTNPTGDYNNNGVVDGADYVAWRNAGPSDTLPNDSTPGTVSQADYTIWRTNFGQSNTVPSTQFRGLVHYVTSFSGSAAAVPEPSCVLLVGLGASLLLAGGRRRNELD